MLALFWDRAPSSSYRSIALNRYSFAIVRRRRGVAALLISRKFAQDGVPQEDGRLFGEVVLITENAE